MGVTWFFPGQIFGLFGQTSFSLNGTLNLHARSSEIRIENSSDYQKHKSVSSLVGRVTCFVIMVAVLINFRLSVVPVSSICELCIELVQIKSQESSLFILKPFSRIDDWKCVLLE